VLVVGVGLRPLVEQPRLVVAVEGLAQKSVHNTTVLYCFLPIHIPTELAELPELAVLLQRLLVMAALVHGELVLRS